MPVGRVVVSISDLLARDHGQAHIGPQVGSLVACTRWPGRSPSGRAADPG